MPGLEHFLKTYLELTPPELEVIAKRFRHIALEKGAFFLQTGAFSDRLGIVEQGLVRIFLQTEDKEVTQWISTAGGLLTDLTGFVFGSPARWNMQALSDCSLWVIEKEAYYSLESEVPRFHHIDRRFVARCFSTLEDRIFSHLHMSAEERYQYMFERQPQLFNQVPLQYLASMLGMTPETLSRLRKKII
ncbi:MAG: Crp/Fnr family transcriptional regulator [Bacteroidetes bacterium]|nr:MAG: Crp/Fnr family transcriptional regulator [Bacteroidota bacterium]